jgi:hypothetical protein
VIGPRNTHPHACKRGHTDRWNLIAGWRDGWAWYCRECARLRYHRNERPLPTLASVRAEDIQFWRESGYSHEDIAIKLGVKLVSHYRWLDRHGLKP